MNGRRLGELPAARRLGDADLLFLRFCSSAVLFLVTHIRVFRGIRVSSSSALEQLRRHPGREAGRFAQRVKSIERGKRPARMNAEGADMRDELMGTAWDHYSLPHVVPNESISAFLLDSRSGRAVAIRHQPSAIRRPFTA